MGDFFVLIFIIPAQTYFMSYQRTWTEVGRPAKLVALENYCVIQSEYTTYRSSCTFKCNIYNII